MHIMPGDLLCERDVARADVISVVFSDTANSFFDAWTLRLDVSDAVLHQQVRNDSQPVQSVFRLSETILRE